MTRLFAGTPFDREPTCETCGQIDSECVCPPPKKEWADPTTQHVTIGVEKRAKGKRATVLRGLGRDTTDLAELCQTLQSACGCGGTVKGDVIELQGDQLATTKKRLALLGFQVTQ